MLSNHLLKAVAVVVGLSSLHANASLIKNGSFEDAFDGVAETVKMSNKYIYQPSRHIDSLGSQATDNRWGVYNYLPQFNGYGGNALLAAASDEADFARFCAIKKW